MAFPLEVESHIKSPNGDIVRKVVLNSGLSVILGPNGSGKTHLLRGLKRGLTDHTGEKKCVRFMSAGRIGSIENARSDFDGYRGEKINYAAAVFGNMSDLDRRNKIETLNGDFQTLSQRPDIFVKIQERLRKLFKRNIEINWDGGQLRIDFSRTDTEQEAPYSSGLEASGLLHLVGLLCAVYSDEIGVLLIDEPEVSLHPQLQAFLFSEMRGVSGLPEATGNNKIIVIATHSTEMIRLAGIADLNSLIFCYDLKTGPVQVPSGAEELKNRKVQSFAARMGQEHKLALFSTRPLLVEGPSDSIICGTLSRFLELHLEAAGSQVLPVIGKGDMPVVVKFFRLLGKRPIVLADADGVADGLDLVQAFFESGSKADELAKARGFDSASKLARDIYQGFCEEVDKHWESIEPVAAKHAYWVTRGPDEKQAKRRAALATLFALDATTLATVEASANWKGIRSRMTVLFDFLEDLGCFVLRRGTIENYYQSQPPVPADKIAWSIDEMATIEGLSQTQALTAYADIVRCVQNAAQGQSINEAESLRDVLLSIATPALAKVQEGGSTLDVQQLARSLLRERSKLFSLSVTNKCLTVNLESSIMKVPGFPLTLSAGDDPIKVVNLRLGLATPAAKAP